MSPSRGVSGQFARYTFWHAGSISTANTHSPPMSGWLRAWWKPPIPAKRSTNLSGRSMGMVPLVRGAHGVLELPVGTVDASGTVPGDRLTLA